jgi:subtilisin-like proprotein convertase family protein
MNVRRSARLAILGAAGIAAAAMIAGVSTAAAKTKTATFNQCVSGAVAIPDEPTAPQPTGSAALAIPVSVPKFKGKQQDGVVTAFSTAGIRISHTDDGDLVLNLISPGGKVVGLGNRRDDTDNNSGDGFGSGATSCSGSLVNYSDAFTTSISTPGNTVDDSPITGNFKPEQPLSTFVGGPARGFWTLVVTDVSGDDVGAINALSLNFTYQYKVKPKKKHKK